MSISKKSSTKSGILTTYPLTLTSVSVLCMLYCGNHIYFVSKHVLCQTYITPLIFSNNCFILSLFNTKRLIQKQKNLITVCLCLCVSHSHDCIIWQGLHAKEYSDVNQNMFIFELFPEILSQEFTAWSFNFIADVSPK